MLFSPPLWRPRRSPRTPSPPSASPAASPVGQKFSKHLHPWDENPKSFGPRRRKTGVGARQAELPSTPPPPNPRGPRLPPPGSSPRGQLAVPRRTRHKAYQSRRRGGGGTPARASLPLLASSCPLIRTQPTPRPASAALPLPPLTPQKEQPKPP